MASAVSGVTGIRAPSSAVSSATAVSAINREGAAAGADAPPSVAPLPPMTLSPPPDAATAATATAVTAAELVQPSVAGPEGGLSGMPASLMASSILGSAPSGGPLGGAGVLSKLTVGRAHAREEVLMVQRVWAALVGFETVQGVLHARKLLGFLRRALSVHTGGATAVEALESERAWLR